MAHSTPRLLPTGTEEIAVWSGRPLTYWTEATATCVASHLEAEITLVPGGILPTLRCPLVAAAGTYTGPAGRAETLPFDAVRLAASAP